MEKVLIKTVHSLTFAGSIEQHEIEDLKEGILLKINEKTDFKIWIPKEEIKNIFLNGEKLEYKEMKRERMN